MHHRVEIHKVIVENFSRDKIFVILDKKFKFDRQIVIQMKYSSGKHFWQLTVKPELILPWVKIEENDNNNLETQETIFF